MLFKDDYLILNNFVYGIINKNLNNVIQIKNYVIREGEDNGSLINLQPPPPPFPNYMLLKVDFQQTITWESLIYLPLFYPYVSGINYLFSSFSVFNETHILFFINDSETALNVELFCYFSMNWSCIAELKTYGHIL